MLADWLAGQVQTASVGFRVELFKPDLLEPTACPKSWAYMARGFAEV